MTAPGVMLRVISLPDADDRRAAVRENLRDLPFDWAFTEGCRGDAPSALVADPARQADRFGRALTPAETGVFKSHLKALSAFDDPGAPDWLMVMEDDVWCDTGFDMGGLLAVLDARGIGYCRLFARRWKPATEVLRMGERQLLHLRTDPYGAQGYVIRREAAARFLARLDAIDRPVDDELGRFWENGLDIFMVFPFPMVERAVPSMILAERDAAWAAPRRMTPARLVWRVRDWAAKRLYLLLRRPAARARRGG